MEAFVSFFFSEKHTEDEILNEVADACYILGFPYTTGISSVSMNLIYNS